MAPVFDHSGREVETGSEEVETGSEEVGLSQDLEPFLCRKETGREQPVTTPVLWSSRFLPQYLTPRFLLININSVNTSLVKSRISFILNNIL